MFCTEVMALCCENLTVEYIGCILYGQNTKFLSAAVGVLYSLNSALID
jgi:hypothetical protein